MASYIVQFNTDYTGFAFGGDYLQALGTAQECAALCTADEECTAFAYVPTASACFFKSYLIMGTYNAVVVGYIKCEGRHTC